MTKASAVASWQRALIVLSGTVLAAVLIAALYWAQVVFIPVALAILLAFLLNPLVKVLQRRHVGRVPAVIMVVLLAGLLLTGLGWVVIEQATAVLKELPDCTTNIKEKIQAFQELGAGSEIGHMLEEISGQLQSKPGSPAATLAQPATVVVQPESPAWLGRVPSFLRATLESLGGLALALVLAVFMLLKREDLRNRFIRLVGHGHLTVTTKAVDEAAQRISRYLLMQLAVNAVFGLVLGIGLFLIGLEHAVLWGVLAGVLRYVPYIGAWMAAVVLVALSVALFPGWLQPLLVFGLIMALELVTSNALEPMLYGHSLGVSEVALLVAAAFWAFLWGPIGLVLSGPLTVCVLVLGKYVPQLEFFEVLLGDAMVLEPDVMFYQRLLARDQDEASGLLVAHAKKFSPEAACDQVLVPALIYLKRDGDRDELTEADEQYVLEATRQLIDELSDQQPTAAAGEKLEPANGSVAGRKKIRLLGCPLHDEADALALEMLRKMLDPAKWEMDISSTETLSAEMVTWAEEKEPAIVCVGALPPGGLVHARYLCKRLRARLPNVKIVVGRWGLHTNVEQNEVQLRAAGADQVESSLVAMRDHLVTWLPVFEQEAALDLAPSPALA